MTRLLLLSGSSEASAIARVLGERDDLTVVRSLAGVTSTPAALPGTVRTGGFGGVDGLVRYLRHERIDVLVDATHPFAARMPWHAAAAGEQAGVPRLRVLRPPWSPDPEDDWHPVPDLASVGDTLASLGATRPFLALGRMSLDQLGPLPGCAAVVRSIEVIDDAPFNVAASILGRGPFALADELALLRAHRVDALVTRNSGGSAASAKLAAARRVGAPVVVVDRPRQPGGPTAATVDEALAWIDARLAER